MKRLLTLILVGLVLACATAQGQVLQGLNTAAHEPPLVHRLRAENARLRWQNRNLLYNIDVLFKRIDRLNNEITDCLLKTPPE